VVAGGDVSFGREVGQRLLNADGYAPLAGIAKFWSDADLRVVNLESQLSFQHGETQSPRHRLIFTGPPEGANALAAAGVSLVSTANNHAWDYGRPALFETLEHLERAGVRHAGTGRSREEAYRPAILCVAGWKIAVFAVTQVWNQGPFQVHEGRDFVAWARPEELAAGIRKAHLDNDLVLVSYHGGAEYQDAPSDPTRHMVEAALEAGADAVFGHHPHVIQGIGHTNGRPAFFSLGNLVFGPRDEHPWTRYGMLAKISVTPDAGRSYAVCPYRIEDFTPLAIVSEGERQRFLQHVRLASTAVGGIRLGETDASGCTRVEPLRLKHSAYGPPRADRESRPLARR
jgi:poly-gamma-glutamate synthesis protein (capsule biosynthesis protein)